MKKSLLSLTLAGGLLLSLVPAGMAAPKDYQVTGPIVSLTDTSIVVKKGAEEWEVAKDATLKPTDGSELKVGDKVTVHYTMTAKSIEAKGANKEKKPVEKKAAASPAASAAAQ